MDWQSFVPFIPFFASFFGVLTAFLFQWLGKLYDRRKDRKQFLKDIKHELETGSTYLTGAAQLLPTDMWESGEASGFLSLLPHDVRVKFAKVYFSIESHNCESVRLKTPAEMYHKAHIALVVDTEEGLKKLIDDLLKQNIWE